MVGGESGTERTGNEIAPGARVLDAVWFHVFDPATLYILANRTWAIRPFSIYDNVQNSLEILKYCTVSGW